MNPNSRQVYTCISSADRLCISHTVSIFCFFHKWRGELLIGAGDVWICFCKSLPETKSKLSSSQCMLFYFPKTEVKGNVQKFYILTGKKRQNHLLSEKETFIHLYISWCSVLFTTFHFPSSWTVAISLHLSFLAVLLYFLFQFFLFLWRSILLFTGLPASLPVRITILLCDVPLILPSTAICIEQTVLYDTG